MGGKMASRHPYKVQQELKEGADLFRIATQEKGLPAVLICTSYIERGLATVLDQYFINGSTSASLLEPDGPVGSLAVRARLAYSLGLIDKTTMQNAQLIGKIRNRFAHSDIQIDFTDDDVDKLCKELSFPNVELRDVEGNNADPAENWPEAEERFTAIAVFTCVTLALALIANI